MMPERIVLMADDDMEDCELTVEAARAANLDIDFRFIHDGDDLVAYLQRTKRQPGNVMLPRPVIILLDLNMPKMDGHTALKLIKEDPQLASIPIVILSTSSSQDDISQSYKLGAQSYITKPAQFEALVEKLQTLGRYWFETVEVPAKGDS